MNGPNQARTRSISIPNAITTGTVSRYETSHLNVSVVNGRLTSPPTIKMSSSNCTPEHRRRTWALNAAAAASGNGNVSPTITRQTQRQRSYSFRARGNSPARNQTNDVFRPRVSTLPSDALRPTPRSQRSSFSGNGYRWAREDSLSPRKNSSADGLYFGDDHDFYLLRHFTVTPKGDVINKGDLVRQRSRSATSVTTSNGSPGTSPTTSCSSSGLAVGSRKASVMGYDSVPVSRHSPVRIRMLGALGVGKSALVSQFMTSEYMNAYECSQDEDVEKTVSVLLDGEEYELTFIDHPIASDLREETNEARRRSSEWDPLGTSPPARGNNQGSGAASDAYLVVYSVTDRETFEKAIDFLFTLRERARTLTHPVILIGNKSDLVRTREVAIEEGKSVACTYECKFIETSAAIGHRVDELLVGLVTQIRLKARQMTEMGVFRHRVSSFGGGGSSGTTPTPGSPAHLWSSRSSNASSTNSTTGLFHFSRRAHHGSLRYDRHRAKCFLDRLLCRGETAKHKSKSCDNLQVL